MSTPGTMHAPPVSLLLQQCLAVCAYTPPWVTHLLVHDLGGAEGHAHPLRHWATLHHGAVKETLGALHHQVSGDGASTGRFTEDRDISSVATKLTVQSKMAAAGETNALEATVLTLGTILVL